MPQGTPVEARSLVSLTNLAANPPAYPRNPTQKPHEPLVLYIVRVPGSKDVFLSPLKPPTKSSISPESLNASLYYLHASGPEDEAVREQIEEERRASIQHMLDESGQDDSAFAQLNRVRRKPVPGTPPAGQQEEPRSPSPPKQLPSLEDPVAGKPVNPTQENLPPATSPERQIPKQNPTIRRRPLPQLPTGNGSQQGQQQDPVHGSKQEGATLPPVAGDVTPGRASWDGAQRQANLPAPLPPTDDSMPDRASWDGGGPSPRTRLSPGYNENNSKVESQITHPDRGRGVMGDRHVFDKRGEIYPPTQSYIRRPFHITLIRREPTYGNQWNVGTITNSSSTDPSEVAADSAITVEITTPGYKRFAGDNNTALPAGASLESLRHATPTSSESSDPASTNPHPPGPLRFIRRVALPNQASATAPSSPNRTSGNGQYRRHHSSRDMTNLNFGHSHSHPPKPTRANYTFTSPWNGTCTFTTGPNGRTLKCKHIIPGLASTNTSTTATDQDSEASPAVTVGEIRFNLPSTTTMGRVPHPTAAPLFNRHQFPRPRQHRKGDSQTSPPPSSPSPPRAGQSSTYSPHFPDQPPHLPPRPPQQPKPLPQLPPRPQHQNQQHQPPPQQHQETRPQLPPRPQPQPDSHPDLLSEPQLEPAPDISPEPDRLDLSLARERAGGGLRGTSAKLGKLIIEDEGMKMLDLLVAACMGVWWGVYEQG